MKIDARLVAAWKLNRWLPLTIGTLLLLNLGCYLIVDLWVTPEVNQLESRYIELQTQTRKLQQEQAAADNPRAVFARGTADLASFRQRVPEKKEFTRLIGEVFDMAQQTGLNIHQVTYQPNLLVKQNLLEYVLSFSVEGEYSQLKRFISLLESSERLIAIESLGLASGSDSGEKIGLQLRLATYFQMEST